MTTELEIQRKLLIEAEAALKTEQSRSKNVFDALAEAKGKVVTMMERGHWDDAQTALLQAKVLAIRCESTASELRNAERRVDTLRASLTREEERQARQPIPGVYVPYQPAPKEEPKADQKQDASKPEAPKQTPYSPEPYKP